MTKKYICNSKGCRLARERIKVESERQKEERLKKKLDKPENKYYNKEKQPNKD